MNVREAIKMLHDDGWELDRQAGSHRQFRHPDKPGTVTVAGKLGNDLRERHAGQHPPAGGPERGPSVMNEYLVVIEGSGDSFSAFVPDLPGCVAAGDSAEEVEQLMAEAIALHVGSLRSHGESVPEPHSAARYVAI